MKYEVFKHLMVVIRRDLRRIAKDNDIPYFNRTLLSPELPRTLEEFVMDALYEMKGVISKKHPEITNFQIADLIKINPDLGYWVDLIEDNTLSFERLIIFWNVCYKNNLNHFLNFYINKFDYHIYSL